MIEAAQAKAMADRWRVLFPDEMAFERSWRKYWDTAIVPDATRLEAWLQSDLSKCQVAEQVPGRPPGPVNAIGRRLEYIHADRQVCPMCEDHFEGAYSDHVCPRAFHRDKPDSSVNNLRFERGAAKERYLAACQEQGYS